MPLNKPRIPCGNSVMRNNSRTATSSIVVRSVRRWHFDGLEIYVDIEIKFRLTVLPSGVWESMLFTWSIYFINLILWDGSYLCPLSAWFALAAFIAPLWLYPFSLTFLLAAWYSTFIKMKLMTVNTKHGNSFIITECIQKLILIEQKVAKKFEIIWVNYTQWTEERYSNSTEKWIFKGLVVRRATCSKPTLIEKYDWLGYSQYEWIPHSCIRSAHSPIQCGIFVDVDVVNVYRHILVVHNISFVNTE